MNTATHTIQNQEPCARLRLVVTENKQRGMIVKIKSALRHFFGPSRSLDFEMWRDLEFRNEREPERQRPIQLSRWI